MVVVDTDFLVDVRNGKAGAVRQLRDLLDTSR